jgi:general secretion pathway protein H
MPTSTAARSIERRPPAHRRAGAHGQAGFTLIELGLVLLIIAVALTFIVPRFRDQSHVELLSQTRRLATLFRFLQHEAILNGRVYQLNFDLDQQRYFVTSADAAALDAAADAAAAGADDEDAGDMAAQEEAFLDPAAGAGMQRETGILARDIVLPNTVQIADVDLPTTMGKVYEGPAFVNFYPDGYIDPAFVHLDNGQEVYTLYVSDGITGRAYVVSGYLELGTQG